MKNVDEIVKGCVSLFLATCGASALFFTITAIGYAWDGMYDVSRQFVSGGLAAIATGLVSLVGLCCIYSNNRVQAR